MAQGPFTQSQREVMGEGICTIAMLLDMLGKQRQEHGWLWDELQSPGVLLTGVRMEGMPSVADVVEQQTSHGTVQIAAVCLGLWVPFFPTVLASDISSMPWNSPDQVLDFNSARPLGVQYRLKASSKGGYSPKQFVFCSQADVSKAWMPDEVNSKPRFVLLTRGRPGRFISVPDHKTVVNIYGPAGAVLLEKVLLKLPLLDMLREADYFITNAKSSTLTTLRCMNPKDAYCTQTRVLIEQAAISVKDSLEFTAGESRSANQLDLDAWVRTEKRLLKLLQVDGLMQTSNSQSKQQETAMKLRLDCTMKDFRPVQPKASRRASAVAAAAILDQDGSARRKSSGTLPGSPHAGEDEDDEEDEGGHQKKKSAPKPRAAETVASGRSAAARLTAAALLVDSSDAESVVAAGK